MCENVLGSPPAEFEEAAYLRANADVAAAVSTGQLRSAWHHAVLFGHREGRQCLPDSAIAAIRQIAPDFVIPPPDLRERVHTEDLYGFYHIGSTIAADIDEVLASVSLARQLSASVLDFGAGCGRVIQWMKKRHPGWAFAGCDIDAQAMSWCNAYLQEAGSFAVNNSQPPLSFAAGCFDFVYSVSVFTHLPEDMQFAWLAELRRVIKADGVALLSVHGLDLLPSRTDYAANRRNGFVYVNGTHTAAAGMPEFYQTTYHSEDYIRRNWSQYFRISEIIPKRINWHQDLVVCTR